MGEDFSKYLSIDNGKGLLIKRNDAVILEHYGFDYYNCSDLGDLIRIVSEYIDDHYDEEVDDLEEVLSNLVEVYYYTQVKK